ncbi:hypothetical protein MtrunA17_Chr6g0468061 [Medicago truncatula]|uniref:Transmembrane protein n=1 Tax=Medicago truncatula TaxID=3880 RepID=A0A396HDJ0_MEDTR|nr:hypothetical protein MtrunA17_Chr6g0468061 [Medicago truncatula]
MRSLPIEIHVMLRSGYSEAEPRRSDFFYEYENGRKSGVMEIDGSYNRRLFSLRESDFKGMDESRFIDLKLDYSSASKQQMQISPPMQKWQIHSAFGRKKKIKYKEINYIFFLILLIFYFYFSFI